MKYLAKYLVMKKKWENYISKIKRIYNIIFETRDLEEIRADYYAAKWISKEELRRLMKYEIEQLTNLLIAEKDSSKILFENFNLATMRNSFDIEEKTIKSGRKY
jgi:hypothetical protein